MMELKDIVLKKGDIIIYKNGNYHLVDGYAGNKASQIFDSVKKIQRPIKYVNIYEAPKQILDKEEKEYLETVLRPFRIQIEGIYKKHNYNNDDYEYLFFDARLHNNKYSFILPYFEKSKKYKEMELDKKYTIEELGLFKE